MKKLLTPLLLFLLASAAVPVLHAGSVDADRKSAEQGDAASQFSMGLRYATGKDVDRDFSTAAEWYRKAAQQGHKKAQTNLGNLYARVSTRTTARP